MLFGDAAGAVVLSGTNDGTRGILSTHLHSDGRLWKLLHIPGGGVVYPASAEMVEKRDYCIRMQGSEVFKHAVRSMADVAQEALTANELGPDDIFPFHPTPSQHTDNEKGSGAL